MNVNRMWVWKEHYDLNVPDHLEYPTHPLHDILTQAAKETPQRVFTLFEGSRITFTGIDELTNDFARGLLSAGLKRGERVAVLLPNLPQFVVAYFGILKAGGVVVAINPAFKIPEIAQQTQETGARMLVALDDYYSSLALEREKIGIDTIILTNRADAFRWAGNSTDEPDRFALYSGDWWMESFLMAGKVWGGKLPVVVPDDPAIFQYSGGTTNIPRAVIGTHRNLVSNTYQFRAWIQPVLSDQDVILMAIPMFHVYGMILGLCLATATRASLSLVPNPRNIPMLLNIVEQTPPTIFPAVPTLLHSLVHHPHISKCNLKSIRVCLSGSAPLPIMTQKMFEKLISGPVVEGYGLSEAPTATHFNPVRGENRCGSVGLPLPDVDCQIVDTVDGETPLPVGKVGELLIRGPQVMTAYYNAIEETRNVLRNGWLHTGDLARMDADGYFYIVDRIKDIIKMGGLTVFPSEVENRLLAHPAVLDAVVAGIPDEHYGEVVKAWVVLRPGQAASSRDLLLWCEQSLTRYKVPRQIEFRVDLPRSTIGKVLRRVLVKQHLNKKA